MLDLHGRAGGTIVEPSKRYLVFMQGKGLLTKDI